MEIKILKTKDGEICAEMRRMIPYEVNLKCPECKSGYMINDPSDCVLSTYPAMNRHVCSKCGYVRGYFDVYPKIVYKGDSQR